MDRDFRQGFLMLNLLREKLAISDAVAKRAAHIYRKAHEKDLVRGRSISEFMASAIYAACRDTATPRSLKDIEHAASIKRRGIARCYRLLVKELDLKMPVADLAQCAARIAGRIGIAKKTERDAAGILREARRSDASAGKDPMSLAAGAVYLACVKNGEGKTQRDIAEAAGVSEITIRGHYKSLRRYLRQPGMPAGRAGGGAGAA